MRRQGQKDIGAGRPPKDDRHVAADIRANSISKQSKTDTDDLTCSRSDRSADRARLCISVRLPALKCQHLANAQITECIDRESSRLIEAIKTR